MRNVLVGYVSLFLFSSFSYSMETADTFIIKAYDHKFKVLSPIKYKKQLAIIIYNKTLVSLVGHVKSSHSDPIQFVTVLPGKSKPVDIKMDKGELFWFTPISPSFQEVVLDIGKRAYEIPEKR